MVANAQIIKCQLTSFRESMDRIHTVVLTKGGA
ncbi:hypothetical protein BH10ACT6_BH10ACT6_07650 [soil metagenome]